MEDYRKALLDDFINEAEEKIEVLNDSLLQLEKNPFNKDHINNIFRAAHTLKGGSAAMGFEDFTKVTHAMEDVFHYIRSDKLAVTSEIIDVFLHTIDFLKTLLANIDSPDIDYVTIGDIVASLERILAEVRPEQENKHKIVQPNATPTDAMASRNPPKLSAVEVDQISNSLNEKSTLFYGHIQIKDDVPMISLIVFMIFTKIQSVGSIVWSNPPETQAEDFEGYMIEFMITSSMTSAEIENVLKIPECKSLFLKQIVVEDLVSHEDEQASSDSVGDSPLPKYPKAETADLDAGVLGSLTSTLRVDSIRVDNLLNLVGELLINRSRFAQVLTNIKKNNSNFPFVANLNETVTQLRKITNDLQEGIMQLRMIKIDQIFNKFPRLVRDTSRKLDKSINLEISGQETELDKRVIEEIRDPIMHIVRNCIDHGIETTTERLKAGKPEAGNLSMEAYHEGNQIVIKISDDGAGINPEVIKKKAVSMGVISKAEAQKMTDLELIYLILLPGFSTSQQVNDISGRGVGMDVVKKNIEKLNGTLKIVSEVNKGTSFIIKLPLTLAIIPTLLVKINDGIFAIPLSSVNEIIEIAGDDIKIVNGNEMIALRDMVIPLVRLSNYFNQDIPYKEIEMADVAIINIAEQHIGLIVDACLGEQEIVIKSLTSDLTESAGISGAAILGDGTIALIIDVGTIIRKTAEINSVINTISFNAANKLTKQT